MSDYLIPVVPLTREAFLPFGDVIDDTGTTVFSTNDDTALRIHELGIADCQAEGGRTLFSIFRMKQPSLPDAIRLMERHPLSSQAFMPLGIVRFIALVARPGTQPQASGLHAFVTNGRQGVNYHRGTWHHPLIALDPGDFLVVDRAGPGVAFTQDYDEAPLAGAPCLALDAAWAPLPQN
ncbi:ureidoglycolate lyase [Mesorhizobium sp. A623]